MTRRNTLMVATVLALCGGGLALAQPGPRGGMTAPGAAPVYDPAQLPEVKGKVAQYLLTPRGDVDGFMLADGTEVHVPPFVSTQLVFAVKPGDAVTIHGLKAREVPMVAARSITNDASGATVLVTAPRGPRHGGEVALEAEGKVVGALHEPRGEANGVRLEDGTLVRMPPGEATRLAETLAVGKTLVVKGEGYAGPLGRVIVARQIGADRDHLAQVASPRPMGMPWMRHGDHGKHGEPGRPMMAPPPG